MAKKLLIDANHPEEIRVAVVSGHTLEDFDSETSTKKQIKSNIYLAKVVRVEPSLQAAFVEFGGNRHGFLPFSEIHPDYYRVPVADRPILETETDLSNGQTESVNNLVDEQQNDTDLREELEVSEDLEPLIEDNEESFEKSQKAELRSRTSNYRYKIQEVIKRRHIMLVQVVKEERGTKGASLTTYLSLPGRYCVLMPNAGYRAGGVSRKINDGEDRRRLRDVVKELSVPEGMALIVRTAGQERNKTEIRRDYEYLLRLWNDIRELTLKSIAPCLVYAEGDLVKRAIRDIYNRDIDEVLVEGEEAYKQSKAFMRQLIPSHARKVKLYKDANCPLFHRFRVEEQIDLMMSPVVRLPSGGSIVINTTEALVAIDVNSGRSTRERHIDETALKTNLEAAEEVARQMRLRDLAGLVVVDFIDMSDPQHIQQIEKRMRDAVKADRARIQLGKISQFGLMELSRQRLRPSLIETYTTACSHCHGTGVVRSVESTALHVLRAIETCALQQPAREILINVPSGIELYLLNQKRQNLVSIENRFSLSVHVTRDPSLNSPDFRLDVLSVKGNSGLALAREESLEAGAEKEKARPSKKPENGPDNQDDNQTTGATKARNRRRQRRRRSSAHVVPPPSVSQESQPEQPLESLVQAVKPSNSEERLEPNNLINQENGELEKKPESKINRRRRYPRKRSASALKSQFIEKEGQDNAPGEIPSPKPTTAESETIMPEIENKPSSPSRRRSRGWLRRLLDS